MKIAYIGRFTRIYDEEYIARSFEMLGHTVMRLSVDEALNALFRDISRELPDLVLFAKFPPGTGTVPYSHEEADRFVRTLRQRGFKTATWVFDLYYGYFRHYEVRQKPHFRTDHVFTTDGGHDEEWRLANINHTCVRQGIYREECYLEPDTKQAPRGIVFVGSDNVKNEERAAMLRGIEKRYGASFSWHGKDDTHAVRSTNLNHLFSYTKVVVGDSVYSPHYWSNRVVETLGRGGMLIHQEVEGLSTEYPHLITYKRGDARDLYEKIDYYLTHEDERLAVVQRNFEWVRDHYTMDKKCADLIAKL